MRWCRAAYSWPVSLELAWGRQGAVRALGPTLPGMGVGGVPLTRGSGLPTGHVHKAIPTPRWLGEHRGPGLAWGQDTEVKIGGYARHLFTQHGMGVTNTQGCLS